LAVALGRVERNRGAAGVDGVSTQDLCSWCREHWTGVRVALDVGTYRPSPVCQVMIPKPDGGQRKLGVPAVLDRLIQQAIAQVLVPVFDPGFVPVSYGFRPGKSAHDAVRVARLVIEQGYRWVVEVDLDAFFDRVNHDVLMARVARKVKDKRLLKLIRHYLEAGIMADGVRQPVGEGTPQGSPLLPLLSNIMLDLAWQWGMSSRGYWRVAGSPILQRALPNVHWEELGLFFFHTAWTKFQRPSEPPYARPARTVV
jgi:RNA-directed DNA polymerase